jgi:hypothetical protein
MKRWQVGLFAISLIFGGPMLVILVLKWVIFFAHWVGL